MNNLEDNEHVKLDISKKDGIITCKVKVPAVCSYFQHRVEISNDDVKKILLRKGYKVYSVIQGGRISNKSETSNLYQIWKFADSEPKENTTITKKVRSVKRRTNTKKQ
jgi:hypothetical protein